MNADFSGLLKSAVKWNTAAWMETGGMIADAAGDLERPVCNEFQREVSDIIEWCHENRRPCRIIILKPRRRGSSTVSVAAGYRRLQAKRGTGCIAGGAHFQGKKLFKMLEIYANNDNIDPKSCTVLADVARFKNGSEMDRITLANPQAGRAGGYQFLVITEMAFLSEEGVADAASVVSGLIKTVQFYPDTIIILESTANGASGDYYERWTKAITFEEFKRGKNGFVGVFWPWFKFDDLRLSDPSSEGIVNCDDLTSDERILANKWGLDLNQIAWMRMTIRDECNDDFEKFQEDYPFDPDTAFRKSGRGRFDKAGLKYQEQRAKVSHPEFGVLEYDERADRVLWRSTSEDEATMVRFEQPRVGCRYIQSTDPATGDSQTSGTDPDSNSAGVLRAGFFQNGNWIEPALAMRTVCYRDSKRFGNWWDTHILEEQVWRMQRYYGSCKTVVEVNKDRGLIELQKLRGDVDIYAREVFNRRTTEVTEQLGWNTDERSRERIISTLANAIRLAGKGKVGEGVELRCEWLVEQCRNFVVKANGRSEAAKGKHDDDVLMVAIGLYLIDHATPYFEAERDEWVPRDLREVGRVDRGGGQWS